jgi:hypothetical protein
MPRFNAAKSWKKLDDDLSGKFNYLCDLLDEGYSSVALINNHEIAIDINPKDGIKIVNDGSSIFSLDPLTGEIVIGKYDDLISDLETDLGTAYNDIAQQLGYADYDDMVAEAIAGNTIINGGWLRTSLIQANTILFNQLASSTFNTINYLSGNLIQNVTMENSMDRWTGDGTLVDEFYDGLTVPVIQLYSNTAHKWAYSEYFRVDPSKAYEVSFWVKKSDAQGNIYIGTHQRSSGGAAQTVTSVNASTGGVVSTTDSNFYFSYCTTGNSPTDWARVVGYILPAGTPPEKCKGLGEYGGTMGNPKVAILHADNYEMRVRVGNYNNTSATYVYVANMKVTQVDAQSVIKMVQTGVSYAGVVIDPTIGFENTATIGGKTATIKVNATEGLAFYDGSTYRGGMQVIGSDLALITDIIKSPNDANTYIKFTADPNWLSAGLYAGVTNFFATDNNFSIGTAQKHFSIIGYLYPDSSQTILNASDRGGMEAGMEIIAGTKASGAPVDVSSLILYGGTDTSNIAQLVVYKANGTSYDLTISPISGLTYNSGKVWHEGNDGSGSTLDADTLDTFEATEFFRKTINSIGLDASISVSQNENITFKSHGAGSTGFPYSHGEMVFFAGSSQNRDFALWHPAGYEELHFVTADANRTGFNTFHKLWHSGNDGAGSGLDADLVYGCTKASITGRQCYNYANGVLVSLIPVEGGKMFFIHVTGNSYASAYGPIDTIIQGYWYQTGFLQCKQTNNGAYLAPAKFMTDNGYFKCWFQQPSASSTLFIKCYTHGDGLINPQSITNVTEPTGANKVTCTLFNSYVPLGRTVNSKALSSNITLDAADVGAVPTARTVSAGTGLSGGGALSSNITLSVGTLPTDSVKNAQVKTTTASTSGTLAADGYVYLNSGTGQMFLPNVNASFRVHLSGQTNTTSYYGAIGLHNTSSSSNGYTVRWTRIASS